jgi:hypothetical protein
VSNVKNLIDRIFNRRGKTWPNGHRLLSRGLFTSSTDSPTSVPGLRLQQIKRVDEELRESAAQ